MGENIGFFPAEEVELRAGRQKGETGVGMVEAAVTHETTRQLVA